MNLAFEARRVYVAPRKSVLFFAVIGEQRLRYYVHETVLLEGRDSARDETEAYKDCLSLLRSRQGPDPSGGEAAHRDKRPRARQRDYRVECRENSRGADAGPFQHLILAEYRRFDCRERL
jgi:hypothetical protein